MIRVTLDAEDFETLVSGGVLKKAWGITRTDDVEIILSDIGFALMLVILRRVAQGR